MNSRTSYIPQPEQVKKLKKETGASSVDCKRAINLCYGDHYFSTEYLKVKGTILADNIVRRAKDEMTRQKVNQLLHSDWFDFSLAEGMRIYVEHNGPYTDKVQEHRIRGGLSLGSATQVFGWPNPIYLEDISSVVLDDPATRGCLIEMARARWGKDFYIESMKEGGEIWWRVSSQKIGRVCRWYEEEWLAIVNAIIWPEEENIFS